jgi:hypothetical protein
MLANMLTGFLDAMTIIAFLATLVSSVIVACYGFIASDSKRKAGWRQWRERWKCVPENVQRFHFFCLCALTGLMILGFLLRYTRK